MKLWYSKEKGFLSSDATGENIPADAIEITREHKNAVQAERISKGQFFDLDVVDGELVVVAAPFDEAEIKQKRHAIYKAYSEAMRVVSDKYPQAEIDSWSVQLAEAKMYRADLLLPGFVLVPEKYEFLNNLAIQSGQTLESRVDRVEEKYAEYAPFAGALTGKLHALNYALDAVDVNAETARDDVSAIDENELLVLSSNLVA